MDTEIVKEDLRKWFKDGGWNRYNTKGEKVGKCAREDKDGDGKADGPKPKCLPASKAASLGKKKVAAAVKRKRAEDPNPDRTGAAKNVKTESIEHIKEFVGTTIAGTAGAATAKKKDRVRKAVGTGAGYAVGSTLGKVAGAALASKLPGGSAPIVGGAIQGAGSAVGQVAGGVGGAVAGNKLAGETKKKKKTNEEVELDEKCWKGYEKKGMKTMFGKRYPNCVKKEEFIPEDEKTELQKKASRGDKDAMKKLHQLRADGKIGKEPGFEPGVKKEEVTFQQFNEKAMKCWDTHKKVGMKMKGGKLVNDCRPKNEEVEVEESHKNPESVKGIAKELDKAVEMHKSQAKRLRKAGVSEGAAWTKSEGKNKKGGLNEKGRKSYERENPGSDLKAPSKKVGNPRRASFCARMKGMKKKLTSKKTANDPDSRINKSLRAWNC